MLTLALTLTLTLTLTPNPDRSEQAKHGFGRCLRPPVASDACAWPDNARRFMQGLGVAAHAPALEVIEPEPRASCFGSSEEVIK